MLVLSRQRNERIVIRTPAGEVLEISVADIRGDKVRLGVQAPADHTIYRKELEGRIAAAERSTREPG